MNELQQNFPYVFGGGRDRDDGIEYAPHAPPQAEPPQVRIPEPFCFPACGLDGFANEPIVGEWHLMKLDEMYLAAVCQHVEELAACIEQYWSAMSANIGNSSELSLDAGMYLDKAFQHAHNIGYAVSRLAAYPQLFNTPDQQSRFFEEVTANLKFLLHLLDQIVVLDDGCEIYCTHSDLSKPKAQDAIRLNTGRSLKPWQTWLMPRPTRNFDDFERFFPKTKELEALGYVPRTFQVLSPSAALIAEQWRDDYEDMAETIIADLGVLDEEGKTLIRRSMPPDTEDFAEQIATSADGEALAATGPGKLWRGFERAFAVGQHEPVAEQARHYARFQPQELITRGVPEPIFRVLYRRKPSMLD